MPRRHNAAGDVQFGREEYDKACWVFENQVVVIDTSACRFPEDLGEMFAAPAWEDAGLQAERKALTDVKSRLDAMENRVWEKAALQNDRAAEVKFMLRREFRVEMASLAWAKMFETIHTGNFFQEGCPALHRGPDGRPQAFTVHLCEAPGAFIAATNHFMKTLRPQWGWDWLAMSLNPHYEGNNQFAMIDDDVLINTTIDHWCWGADNSGDLRQPNNIEYLWEAARQRSGQAQGGAMLVTADGAVDSSMDPNRQEELCADLQLCEIIAALGLLSPGGHFMLKAFTLFEHSSISQVYLMGCLFDGVAVYKPCTSKPANSEVYVLGRGFKGVSPAMMTALKNLVSPNEMFKDRTMFSLQHLEASGQFMDSIRHAAITFSRLTAAAISEALERWGLIKGGQLQQLRNAKRDFAFHWGKELQVMHLDPASFLASGKRLDSSSSNNTGNLVNKKQKLTGTLQDQQQQVQV